MFVTTIIPAYNERGTIKGVLLPVILNPRIIEVIIVNDGSNDGTLELLQELQENSSIYRRIKIINLEKNQGKTNAICEGFKIIRTDFVLLLDADLIGLKFCHINDLLNPVLSGRADMTIGLFKGGRFLTDLAHKTNPGLSGQRAMKKECLDKVNWKKVKKFGFEIYLTHLINFYHWKVEEVVLFGVTHKMKQEKRGFFLGWLQRLEMYFDILFQYIRNYIT